MRFCFTVTLDVDEPFDPTNFGGYGESLADALDGALSLHCARERARAGPEASLLMLVRNVVGVELAERPN